MLVKWSGYVSLPTVDYAVLCTEYLIVSSQ